MNKTHPLIRYLDERKDARQLSSRRKEPTKNASVNSEVSQTASPGPQLKSHHPELAGVNKDILEEPDEDSSCAVHVLCWDSDTRRGVLSGSPRLTACHNVVEDGIELREKLKKKFRRIGEKLSSYGRPSTFSAVTASHRITKGKRARQRCGRNMNAGSAVQGNGDHHPQ